MRVLNATTLDKKLAKGSPLTHSKPITLVTPPDIQQPQVQDTILTFQEVTRPNLNAAESRELEELTETDISLLCRAMYTDGSTVYHHMNTGEVRPIRQTSWRLSLAKQEEVLEMLNDLQ
jgi:hypothetical protein